MNPEFIQYQQNLKTYGLQNATVNGHALGYIPSPVDMSHLAGLSAARTSRFSILAAPVSYDLRDTGKLTAVRDQGSCGSCWTFATMASLESNLLPSETRDFSENNLKNTSGFDLGACAGGNAYMSMAYLSRWSGPVNESDDPYNEASGVSPSGLTTRKHIQEVLFIPDRTSSADNDNIKQAVMTYGAVYTSMYYDNAYYNAAHYAYYYNGSTSSNHAVAIVGWDDNYSSANFSPSTPAGNGAFIIKNSWGTAWGESGYFYISYYDAKIGKANAVFNNAQLTTNFSRRYEYDPLGRTSGLGYTGSDTAWLANIFTAPASEQLTAVAFYTTAPNATYTIKIYTNVGSTPTSGTLAGSTTSGSIASAGYHTITLSTPISLTSSQKFSVVVQLTTPGYNYPIPIEYPVSGYSSPTAGTGQSFFSNNGTSWTDMTDVYPNTNVCLKALTAIAPTVTTAAITGITPSAASGGGNVTSTGGASVTAKGVCWSIAADPTIADTCTNDGAGAGAFSSSITSLTPLTTYHVRAYATSSIGTGYGSDVQFTTTAPAAPTVATAPITGITLRSAAGGGNVTSDGGASATVRGVCWSTAADPTIVDTCTNDGSGTGSFSSSVTGLTLSTTYHVRAYATNSVGTGYGSDVQFTSLATVIAPTVTTSVITGITSTTASGGGNVTSDGGASVTVRGVCWSASANPTTIDSHTTDGTGTGAYASSLTGLTPGMTYHVRAYATNSAGTAYGDDRSFTTGGRPSAPTGLTVQ